MTKTPRQRKTPRARAEEALAVAERRVKKLRADEARHRDALTATTADLEQAVVRRDYLKGHPDLNQHSTATPTAKETST